MKLRLQFRLRTLLIVVMLAAIPCGWLARDYSLVQSRLREHLLMKGYAKDTDQLKSMVFWRRWMGDYSYELIWCGSDEIDRMRELFPEAKVFEDDNPDHSTWEEQLKNPPLDPVSKLPVRL